MTEEPVAEFDGRKISCDFKSPNEVIPAAVDVSTWRLSRDVINLGVL